MRTDPTSGIRVLGDPLDYEDGAEDELLEIMLTTDDRSAGSDELARRISDWPTLYHLSRRRANLLRPFKMVPGMRVLDVGAGTGAMSRALGDAGCEVVALEGSIERARVAAARCAGLGNVEVCCGDLASLPGEGEFDAVLLIGVLEYSGSAAGGAGGPQGMLERAVSHLKPDGVLVLAIENKIGLKYLLGYREDHLGEAFAGVEGYRCEGGIRTWARRELADLVEGAGLMRQRWLFPFPDYKLPVTVLSERAYSGKGEPDSAVDFVDQWVRSPVRDHANPPLLLCDDRSAHRTFLEAGLGPDVANSFLVVASRDADRLDEFVEPGVVAWRFGEDRSRLWARDTEVREGSDGNWTVVRRKSYPDEGRAERGWLAQHDADPTPYLRGRTLEQDLLDAIVEHDLDEASALLDGWRRLLDEVETKAVDRDPVEAHPFLPAASVRMLPASHLDVAFDNIVVQDDGSLVLVDNEWELPEGVDRPMVEVRALWSLAQKLVLGGQEHPWSAEVTVDEMCIQLGALSGRLIDIDLLERWRAAEALLQAKVSGDPAERTAASLVDAGRTSRATSAVARALPWTAQRREVARVRVELAAVRAQLDEAEQRVADLEPLSDELAAALRLVDELTGRPLEAVVIPEEVYHELAEHRAWKAKVEGRLPVRLYLGLKRRLGMIH